MQSTPCQLPGLGRGRSSSFSSLLLFAGGENSPPSGADLDFTLKTTFLLLGQCQVAPGRLEAVTGLEAERREDQAMSLRASLPPPFAQTGSGVIQTTGRGRRELSPHREGHLLHGAAPPWWATGLGTAPQGCWDLQRRVGRRGSPCEGRRARTAAWGAGGRRGESTSCPPASFPSPKSRPR